MPIWAQIVVPIVVSAGTLIVTTVLTYFLGWPKRQKQRKAEEYQGILDKIEEVKNHLSARDDRQDEQREKLHKNVELLKFGTQMMLKNDLKLRYEHWLSKGYAPIDSKEDLEKMYQAYHSLGANGVMDGMRAAFLALPNERINRNKKKIEECKEIDSAKG